MSPGKSAVRTVRRVARRCAATAFLAGIAACAGDSPAPAPPAEPAAPAASEQSGAGLQVTGTAPTSLDGSLTVVVLEPLSGSPFEVPEEPVQMDQLGMEFLPPVLLASVGQPVHFHNSEDVLHNVRVYNIDTLETAFNISTPIGGTYEHRFDTAGTYRVACDIHPAMGASVVVTASPHAAVAARDGSFALEDVAAGSYTAVVQAGAERSRHAVTIAPGATELALGGS
ncbi:MAG: plastocyanin/azurin family copper-binding protein [Acidobacteria bacterium]|nr:plastocyanin/azurin family copper-binding protein [Acidobacteriota bacterium]